MSKFLASVLLSLSLFGQVAGAVTQDFTWRIPHGGTVGSWGLLNSFQLSGVSTPVVTVKLTGSGTHTLSTNPKPKYVRFVMVGAGAGGTSGGTAATDGTDTTVNSTLLVAGGGKAGIFGSTYPAGGSSSSTAGPVGIALNGADGFPGSGTVILVAGNAGSQCTGGNGGSSFFGGAGIGQSSSGFARPSAANSGSGGGGSCANLVGSIQGFNGGGAGGFIDMLITSPALSYTYSVGVGGSGGPSGTGYGAGASGASGLLLIYEYFQ